MVADPSLCHRAVAAGAAARAAMPSQANRCALVRASSPATPLPPTSTPTPKLRTPTSSSVFSTRPGTPCNNLKFSRGLIGQTVTQVNSAIRTCLQMFCWMFGNSYLEFGNSNFSELNFVVLLEMSSFYEKY